MIEGATGAKATGATPPDAQRGGRITAMAAAASVSASGRAVAQAQIHRATTGPSVGAGPRLVKSRALS